MPSNSVGVPELMGAVEAANELGVNPANLNKVAGLPEPVQVLKRGAVWRAADIRSLARRRRRVAAQRDGGQEEADRRRAEEEMRA